MTINRNIVESFQKNRKGISLMLLSSACVCIGQLFWKLSAAEGIIYLLFGFLFYGIGAFLMIIAYRYGKLSVLQPMLSLNYVFSIILGAAVFKENVTLLKVAGVLVIMAGVIMIVTGDDE
jgi:undecaprenyl phosphate-alpha-L-ara4N flippase subunit ArnE